MGHPRDHDLMAVRDGILTATYASTQPMPPQIPQRASGSKNPVPLQSKQVRFAGVRRGMSEDNSENFWAALIRANRINVGSTTGEIVPDSGL